MIVLAHLSQLSLPSHLFVEIGIARHHRAAVASRGEILARMKAETTAIAEGAYRLSIDSCAYRLRRIFDQKQAVPPSERDDLAHRGGLPIQVDRQKGAGAGADGIPQLCGVDEKCLRIRIHQDGLSPDQLDCSDGGVEGVGLGDDLVPPPDPKGAQGNHQGVGTAVDAPHVGRSQVAAELTLKVPQLRTQLIPAADEHRSHVSDKALDVSTELMGKIVPCDSHGLRSCNDPTLPAPSRPDKSSSTPNSTIVGQSPAHCQQRSSAARATS